MKRSFLIKTLFFLSMILTLCCLVFVFTIPKSSAQEFLSPAEIKTLNESKKKSVPVFKKVIYHKASEVLPTEAPKVSPSPSLELKKKETSEIRRMPTFSIFPTAWAFGSSKPVEPKISPSPFVSAVSKDLRSKDSPVKSQFGGTCTTFGLSAAMENFLGASFDMSERHLWSTYSQFYATKAVQAALKNSIGDEPFWPMHSETKIKEKPSKTVRLSKIVYLGDSVVAARDKLLGGFPVYVAMQVPQELADCRAVVRYSTPITKGGHAMAVSGYMKDDSFSGGGYFILKNSWGQRCGDRGYQYFPAGLCSKPGMYCYFWSIEGVSL